MMVVGVQVRSASDRVSETTYFCARVDRVRERVAAALGPRSRRDLIGAAALQQDLAALGVLVDDCAHHLGVEELERPTTVTEPATGVLVLAARRLHDAIETHELADENSHCVDPFVEVPNLLRRAAGMGFIASLAR